MMNIDSLYWMLFPLIVAVFLAVMMPNVKRSRKSTMIGLIVSAAIVGVYIVWRFTQGGF
jgi:hypothetical protein